MAANRLFMELFEQTRQLIGRSNLSVLSADYPDLLLSPEDVTSLYGPEIARDLPLRPDSEAILRWHGMTGRLPGVFDTTELFRRLGCRLDVIDLAEVRGGELVADLNYPLPASWHGRFDLVMDTGTCEHVFNAGQAFINLASTVKPGGFIVQAVPLSSYNHGFYNVNPTLPADFYCSDNGYELAYLKGFINMLTEPQQFDVPLHDRFREVPDNAIMIAVAKRLNDSEVRPVVQFKYRLQLGK